MIGLVVSLSSAAGTIAMILGGLRMLVKVVPLFFNSEVIEGKCCSCSGTSSSILLALLVASFVVCAFVQVLCSEDSITSGRDFVLSQKFLSDAS